MGYRRVGHPSRPSKRAIFERLERRGPPPIPHALDEIAHYSLAILSAIAETPLRARGATVAQHSVQVADAGSNPAGSILPSVEKKLHSGREHRDNLPK